MPRPASLPLTAAMLALGIFVIDTFSSLQFSVAVLYVIVVLVVGFNYRRRHVVIAATACVLLTVASYLLVHGPTLQGTAPLRCMVSLAATAVATFLTLTSLSAIERLRATERERTNLARFFSPQLVDQLVEIDEPLSVARYQPAAVMFVDVVGFTDYCAGMKPAAVIAFLRDLLATLSDSVFAHDGIIDKFLGDGFLAVFGPPMSSPHNATNAARCALDIQRRVERWNEQHHRTGDAAIRMAIGIHYGDVVQGDIGSDKRMELTVVGGTVNIASRIEAHCRVLDTSILVSDAFVDALRAEGGENLAGAFTDQGAHALRGYAEPLRLHGVKR